MKIVLVFFLSFMMLPVFAPSHPEYKVDSPLQQIIEGVLPEEVVCQEGKELIFKAKNGFPVCVWPQTAEMLIERGWGTNIPTTQPIIPQAKEKAKSTVQGSDSTINTVEMVPAASGTALNFYLNDDDLNTSPNGVDVISTDGLIEVTVNGVSIDIPSTMTETTPSSGTFFFKVSLPATINGQPIDQDDIVLIKYFDQTDASGQKRTVSSSFALTKTFANLDVPSNCSRIGHELTIRIYEPDANRDSKNEDKIPLSYIEFRSESIRTTLANSAFDARPSYLLETGPNSDTFEAKIKIPRTVGGQTIHIGDWYELRYIDASTPSGTSEKVILKQRIGTSYC